MRLLLIKMLHSISTPDVPGPVGVPFSGENLTNDTCKLTWYSPEDDGGSAITNYIIEKRESDRMGWTSVSYTVTRNNAIVQGLIDGKGYFFRIAAENIIGMGPFIETDKMVLIKDPICKSDTPPKILFQKNSPSHLVHFRYIF